MNPITTFEKHLQKRYSKIGTPQRDEFERKSKAFAISELKSDHQL